MQQAFLNYMAKLRSDVRFPVCINICVLYPFSPGSYTVDINWYIKLLLMALIPYTTYISCPGSLIPQSVIIEKDCENFKLGIMKWHIFSAQHNHMCFPILY